MTRGRHHGVPEYGAQSRHQLHRSGRRSPWTVRINWDNVPGFDETFNVPAHSFNINSFSTWTYSNANIGNTYNVQVQVDDNDGGIGSDNFNVTVVEDTLRVTNFQTNNSGFDVTFNRAPNLSDLNLYDSLLDGSPSMLEPADVTLVRNGSENIQGSIVWAADTNTLSFVKTGGILRTGNYQVTLFSGARRSMRARTSWMATGTSPLATISGAHPGDFNVADPGPGTRVVYLPDFARGPGQNVDVPATGLYLPIKIDVAAGVSTNT